MRGRPSEQLLWRRVHLLCPQRGAPHDAGRIFENSICPNRITKGVCKVVERVTQNTLSVDGLPSIRTAHDIVMVQIAMQRLRDVRACEQVTCNALCLRERFNDKGRAVAGCAHLKQSGEPVVQAGQGQWLFGRWRGMQSARDRHKNFAGRIVIPNVHKVTEGGAIQPREQNGPIRYMIDFGRAMAGPMAHKRETGGFIRHPVFIQFERRRASIHAGHAPHGSQCRFGDKLRRGASALVA